MTLIEFLTARIDEDETEAGEYAELEWWDGGWSDEHITRVLAERAAKRRIIAHWTEVHGDADDGCDPAEGSNGYGFENHDGHANAMAFVLVSLAEPYRDHPDFDPAWKTT